MLLNSYSDAKFTDKYASKRAAFDKMQATIAEDSEADDVEEVELPRIG